MSESLLIALRQSSPAEKEAAFAELAKEFLHAHGHGPLAIRDGQQTVGYIIDELGGTALPFPKLTAEEEAELRRRAETRGDTLGTEDFIAALDGESRERT
jgi:hypothetical protein